MAGKEECVGWLRRIEDLASFDPAAQAAAFLALRRQLRRCLNAVWASLADADGLVDELITQIFLRQKSPSERGDYTTAWLCTVARNAATDELRRRSIWRRKEALLLASEPAHTTEAAEDDLMRRQMRAALEGLDDDLRRVLELRHLADRKLEDVAKELGIAVSTAWKREKEAFRLLKEKLR